MNQHEKWLRLLAADIRSEGHNGWGNTAEWAADEVKRLQDRVDELERLQSKPAGEQSK